MTDRKMNGVAAETLVRFMSSAQLGARWTFHPESVRRKIRRGEIGSVVIGRRRLIPMEEVQRIEREGKVESIENNNG